jgi:hypothetical protein
VRGVGGSTCASLLLSIVSRRHVFCIVLHRPSLLPSHVINVRLSPSSSHGRCHVLLSLPKVAEGDVWQGGGIVVEDDVVNHRTMANGDDLARQWTHHIFQIGVLALLLERAEVLPSG